VFQRLLQILGIAHLDAPRRSVALADCERVSGPFNGYYVAVYAVPSGRRGYLTFYKVCNGQPPSYWEACCLVKGRGDESAASLGAALRAAEDLAREEIRNLPALHYLAAHREHRPFYRFEWHALVTGCCLHGWRAA
jgi:hypothetical protein